MPSKKYYWKHRGKCIEKSLKWQKDNVEACKKSDKKWNKSEKGKIANKKYREANPEKCKKWNKDWQEDNREKVNKDNRNRRNKNPEVYNKSQREYRKNHPEKMREYDGRHEHKRRSLGFNPLNGYFENSEAHHVNHNDVVYIPKEVHQSISHCLETGKNMEKINKLAIQFI